jgi:hypothetical protein
METLVAVITTFLAKAARPFPCPPLGPLEMPNHQQLVLFFELKASDELVFSAQLVSGESQVCRLFSLIRILPLSY